MAEVTETALACIREEVERAFLSAPGAVLEAALSRIAPADECARAAAYAAWDSIAHPLGGLGDFEDAVACIAAAQGSAEVAEFPRALAVFFSDNGVVAEGVSQSGQDVTRAVARNMCEGATSACRMAAFAGAEVVPVDVGMARGIEDARMVRANVRRGSGNIAHGSAMSRDGAVRAIEVGIAVACGLARAGVRLLAAGEMGIGNTTTSAAVAAVLIRADARSLVGRGAGLSDVSLARKRDVVERAIPPTRSTCSRRWAASTSRRCAASTWGPRPRRRRRSSTGSYPARRPCARRACAPTPWATSWAPTHQANPQARSSFASSA